MEENVNTEGINDEDNIRTVLNILKRQINLYTATKENLQSKAELTRSQRIQKLMMEEKRLSAQFQQIKREIKRYEKKYEKALKKKVKLMKLQIKEDHEKLDFLKQKYCQLDIQVNAVIPHGMINANKQKSKKVTVTTKRKTLKTTKFKQNAAIKKKIRIKIKRNVKLNKRKMLSADSTRQRTLTDLVKVVKPMIRNTRECKVILQRLTREQMNRYVTQKQLAQQQIKAKQQTRRSVQNANRSAASIRKPSWHIKIPKSVFEESQGGNQSPVLSAVSYMKDVKQVN